MTEQQSQSTLAGFAKAYGTKEPDQERPETAFDEPDDTAENNKSPDCLTLKPAPAYDKVGPDSIHEDGHVIGVEPFPEELHEEWRSKNHMVATGKCYIVLNPDRLQFSFSDATLKRGVYLADKPSIGGAKAVDISDELLRFEAAAALRAADSLPYACDAVGIDATGLVNIYALENDDLPQQQYLFTGDGDDALDPTTEHQGTSLYYGFPRVRVFGPLSSGKPREIYTKYYKPRLSLSDISY